MRIIVLVICVCVGACGWTKKGGGGTPYDPSDHRIEHDNKKRL
jgi:hypothetical protein